MCCSLQFGTQKQITSAEHVFKDKFDSTIRDTLSIGSCLRDLMTYYGIIAKNG